MAVPVVCPAGELVERAAGVSACRCRIEHTTISPDDNPRTRFGFCATVYTTCPSWRADKEHVWETRSRKPLLADPRAEGAE